MLFISNGRRKSLKGGNHSSFAYKAKSYCQPKLFSRTQHLDCWAAQGEGCGGCYRWCPRAGNRKQLGEPDRLEKCLISFLHRPSSSLCSTSFSLPTFIFYLRFPYKVIYLWSQGLEKRDAREEAGMVPWGLKSSQTYWNMGLVSDVFCEDNWKTFLWLGESYVIEQPLWLHSKLTTCFYYEYFLNLVVITIIHTCKFLPFEPDRDTM